MSTPINLQKPLNVNGQDVYPQTTVQQVLMPDGRRLNTVFEEEWELLEKNTLTADVKVLDRSKSSDGTPYNLKALKILVTSPIGSTVATLYLKVFDNVEDEYNNFMLELGTASYAATNNPSTAIFQIIPFAKQYISIASSGSYNSTQAVLQQKNLYGCTASTDTPIKRFRLNRHDYTNMLSGTVIEIWGVRA